MQLTVAVAVSLVLKVQIEKSDQVKTMRFASAMSVSEAIEQLRGKSGEGTQVTTHTPHTTHTTHKHTTHTHTQHSLCLSEMRKTKKSFFFFLPLTQQSDHLTRRTTVCFNQAKANVLRVG
jgi:hypothetical protein